MNDDIISRSALKKDLEVTQYNDIDDLIRTERLIDDAPTVESDKEVYEKIETYKNAYRIMSDAFENEVRKNRPRGEWIPVSERRFPDDETEVLIQYGQSMMVGYHIFDHTIYPFGYEDENETGWYDSKDNFICGSDEVIAWMPLPETYKEAENEND